MGCWAWLNALLDPGAIWWAMRFSFLEVRLRLQKKWNNNKKSVIRVLPSLRIPSVLPSHVTWVTLCLAWHLNAPAAERRADWQGLWVGSEVQFDHRLISSLCFSHDGPHRAGGLFPFPVRPVQSLCTAGIFVKRNPVNGRLYFLIVATLWLMNHSLLLLGFLLLCAWFIHCKENALCSVCTNQNSLMKKRTFTFFSVYACFLHSVVLGQPANHRL